MREDNTIPCLLREPGKEEKRRLWRPASAGRHAYFADLGRLVMVMGWWWETRERFVLADCSRLPKGAGPALAWLDADQEMRCQAVDQGLSRDARRERGSAWPMCPGSNGLSACACLYFSHCCAAGAETSRCVEIFPGLRKGPIHRCWRRPILYARSRPTTLDRDVTGYPSWAATRHRGFWSMAREGTAPGYDDRAEIGGRLCQGGIPCQSPARGRPISFLAKSHTARKVVGVRGFVAAVRW